MWLLDQDQAFKQGYALWSSEGSGGFRSSFVNNGMTNNFLFGGKLDPVNISDLVENLDPLNRSGANLTFQSTFYAFADSVFGNSDWGWQMTLGSNTELGVVHSRDMFQLLFQGNKPFAGASADISDLSIELISYQQFGVGLFHKPTMSGFTTSLIVGQQLQNLSLREGAFFTSALGDSLHLAAKGTWQYSDSTRTKLGSGNGFGIALNGIWNLPLPEHKGNFSIEIHDMGLVFWNKRSATYNIDAEASFTGVDLNEMLDSEDYAWGAEELADSLNLQPKYNSFSSTLPGWGRVKFMKKVNQRNVFELGITVRPQLAHVPQLHGGYFQYVNPNTLIGATFDVGGYGNFRVGAELEKWVGERLFIKIGTDDLAGLVLDDLKGRALFVQTAFIINRLDDRHP